VGVTPITGFHTGNAYLPSTVPTVIIFQFMK